MNRIEQIRAYIDHMPIVMETQLKSKGIYAHMHGVSQFCALLALKRNENVELATITGLLHDIYTYKTLESEDHAIKGAIDAREILNALGSFNALEIDMICNAIGKHSQKERKHATFEEILIDADVLQHYLYNPLHSVMPHEEKRYNQLKLELGIL